jgi:predicted dehydrogenase
MISQILGWGCVGTGDLVRKRAGAALRDAQGGRLVRVFGRSLDKARSITDALGSGEPTDQFEDLLADPAIGAIYVCTPVDTHLHYAEAALRAGKHVLVEKPMAMNAGECDGMIAAAKEARRTLGVAYYRRSYDKVRYAMDLIRSGAIGRIVTANILLHSWRGPVEGDWRLTREKAAFGPLGDVGTHRLDLLVHFCGQVSRVGAMLENVVHAYDVEDTATLLMKLQSGATATTTFTWATRPGYDRMEIIGSEGKISLDQVDSPNLLVVRGRETEQLQIDLPANLHLPCVQDFVDAVRDGREPLSSAADGRHVAAILDAARQSADTGRMVDVQ